MTLLEADLQRFMKFILIDICSQAASLLHPLHSLIILLFIS